MSVGLECRARHSEKRRKSCAYFFFKITKDWGKRFFFLDLSRFLEDRTACYVKPRRFTTKKLTFMKSRRCLKNDHQWGWWVIRFFLTASSQNFMRDTSSFPRRFHVLDGGTICILWNNKNAAPLSSHFLKNWNTKQFQINTYFNRRSDKYKWNSPQFHEIEFFSKRELTTYWIGYSAFYICAPSLELLIYNRPGFLHLLIVSLYPFSKVFNKYISETTKKIAKAPTSTFVFFFPR